MFAPEYNIGNPQRRRQRTGGPQALQAVTLEKKRRGLALAEVA